jgi:putative peptidoglycan lipid II flippase
VIAAGSAVVNILLGIALMGPLGHGGLALANSLAVSGEVLVLLLVLRRRIGGVEGRETLLMLGKVLGASLVMSIAVIGVLAVVSNLGFGAFGTLAVGAGVGLVTYVIAGLLLKVESLQRLPGLIFS